MAAAASKQTALLKAVVEAFKDEQRPGLSKIAQLYNAIARMTAFGQLSDGTKLPGERELCAALGISLGTAQKSLNLLMNDGEVVREHGRGTYVRTRRQALSKLWHYRFRNPQTGDFFPVYAKLIDRTQARPDATIVNALGPDTNGYIRIRRLMNISDRFSCWSEMFLGATRFARILKFPISDVESVNLKQILAEEFDAPTLAVHQTVKAQVPTREISKRIGVAGKTPCVLLQIVATSRRRAPITFQKIFVPPVDYEYELTEAPVETARSLAA
jgi:GntR family transcriptional regulator